ncbi:ABC transporter substrate-binding protein [Ruania zhangjianzhongii]|uniref:ABC transporter substrate-binding protein n=1 Tax=Ruania zhangjianzhongii TaxID=2603206 RepID=UPI0011CAB900|nr:extracellular solute-binding protein [Ruania zhangjianzhongii]
MKKYMVAGSVLVAGALTLSACSGGDGGSDGEVTLDFPTWQATEPGYQEFWEAAVEEFEASHSGVTINLEQISFDDYQQSLVTRFAANDSPAIVHLPTRFFPSFADQGFLAGLDDRLAETDILETWPASQDQLMWEGEYQGVLLLNYGYVLYYNSEMLAEADVEVPTSYEELIEAAEQLTDDGVYGIAMDTAQNPNLLTELAWPVVGSGNTVVGDSGYTFTDPAVVEIAEQVRELSQYAPQGLASEQKRQYFADGNAAMMIDGPFVGQLIEDSPNAEVIEVAPPPFEVVPGAQSNSLHVARNVSDEEADLAWEFIDMVASSQWQDRYVEEVGVPAPREGSGAETIADDPALQVFADVLTDAVDVVPANDQVRLEYPAYAEAVSFAVSRLISTDDPVEDVMSELQTRLDEEVPLS